MSARSLFRVLGTLGLSTLLVLGVASAAAAQTPPATAEPNQEIAFRGAMAKYWEDHVTWTRLFIISFAADSPDLSVTTQRLLQNQVDIGNAIKPYYGGAAGDQLTALLKDHILIAADVLTAAKNKDSAKLADAQARWTTNADQLADFLAAANPGQWPADEMRAMMHHHLDLTTQEAVARLNGDWAADAAAYDQVHLHALVMADTLSNGILAQFSTQFSL
jgi:hypothetical protein